MTLFNLQSTIDNINFFISKWLFSLSPSCVVHECVSQPISCGRVSSKVNDISSENKYLTA